MGKTATIELLREVYTGPAWHGPSVLGALAGVATHSVADQLLGMAVHDGYHAGQIKQLALEFAPAGGALSG